MNRWLTIWLEHAFGIKPKEFALVQSFFLFFVGIGMFYTVGATVGDTLFLSSLPPDQVPTTLPFVYIGIAVTGFLSILVYDFASHRVSRFAAIVGTQLVMALSVAGFRFVIGLDADWIYFALVVWLEACALLSITLFYSFAGDYFSTRDARRLYGFIAGGMALGTVISGYATSVAVLFIGISNLLYVCCGLLLFNSLISWIIYRRDTPVPVEMEADEASGEKAPLKVIFQRPYVRLLALMIALSLVMSVVVDYQMKWVASTKSETDLAQFFGTFYGRVGLAQLVFQFLVVPRLLRRLGIINCLLVFPTLIGLASCLLLGGSLYNYFGLGLLSFAAASNFVRITLSETLDLPSRELLFLPLPTRIRVRAQPFMNGALAFAIRGFAGLLMLLLVYINVGMEKLSLVAVLCGLMLILSLLKLKPKYRETLAATLRAHEMDAADLRQTAQDLTMEPMLEELLSSDDDGVVKFTLGLLGDREIGGLAPTLGQLLDSRDASIKVETLGCLGTDAVELLPRIHDCLTDETPDVRGAAVLALCQVAGQEAVSEVKTQLDSGDRKMEDAAIVGLARYCGEAEKTRVLPTVEGFAGSPDTRTRVRAAQLLGAIGQTGNADLLGRLFTDPESQVRRAAAEAIASTSETSLVPDLLTAIEEASLRSAAIRALAAMPPSCVEEISRRIHDKSTPVGDRRTLMQVASRIGGPDAATMLWEQAGELDQDLISSSTAAQALRSLRVREGLYHLSLKRFGKRQRRLYDLLSLLNRAREEIGLLDPFVADVYKNHARAAVEQMLSMFALKHHPRQIDRILFNLFADTPHMRARAIELLDEVLPRRQAPRIIALIQPLIDAKPQRGEGFSQNVRSRLLESEPWLRAVTAYHMARYGDDQGGDINLTEEERDMCDRLEMVAFLKKVPLFSGVTAYQLLEQSRIVDWISLKQGEVLFEQGDEGDACYIVGHGEVSILVNGEEVARLGSNECIGDMALLENKPRSATVRMVTDSRLLFIGAERFELLLSSHPSIAKALLCTLDRRIRKVQAGKKETPQPDIQSQRATLMGVVTRMSMPDLQQIIPIIIFLYQVDLFKDLSPQSLVRLAGIVQEVSFFQGEELFQQGDEGDSLYLVCSGTIDIIVDGNKVASLTKNACLGEMALVGGQPRSAAAVVAEDATLLRLWSEDFDQLLATEPEVPLALLKTLSARLRMISA